jgi:hypothetical protein
MRGLDQARAYVAALAGDVKAVCTWQTIPEAPGAGGYPVIILNGTIDEVWPVLCDYQEDGHGVFVMINEGDGRGRRAENVTALRALFSDQDDPSIVPDFRGCPPSMVVFSGRGEHALWLLKPGERLEDFTPAQKGIAKALRSDPKVSDVARVLRLPGSYHVKGKPRMVELVHCDPSRRYTIAEVLDGLGASPVYAQPRRLSAPVPEGPCALASGGRYRAERYLATIHAVSGSGGDAATFKAAASVLFKFGLTRQTAWDVLLEWNKRNASPPWSEAELAKKLENASRYGGGVA